jgi:hypothetical protein
MSTAQLRAKVKRNVDVLSNEKLQTLADFVGYLNQLPSLPETLSIDDRRKIRRMQKRLALAEKEFREGKGVRVQDLRRKYV